MHKTQTYQATSSSTSSCKHSHSSCNILSHFGKGTMSDVDNLQGLLDTDLAMEFLVPDWVTFDQRSFEHLSCQVSLLLTPPLPEDVVPIWDSKRTIIGPLQDPLASISLECMNTCKGKQKERLDASRHCWTPSPIPLPYKSKRDTIEYKQSQTSKPALRFPDMHHWTHTKLETSQGERESTFAVVHSSQHILPRASHFSVFLHISPCHTSRTAPSWKDSWALQQLRNQSNNPET